MSRLLSRIIRVINQAQRPGRGSGGVWGGGGGSAEGRGWSRGRLTEVLRQQASFSRAVMSLDRAEWRSAAWPEGASHTVKTFSFTRDSCHFLSAEVPSTQPPPTSLRPPSRQHDVQTGTMSGRRFKKNKNKLTTKNQTKPKTRICRRGRRSSQNRPIHRLSWTEGLEEEGEEAALIGGTKRMSERSVQNRRLRHPDNVFVSQVQQIAEARRVVRLWR